MDLLGAIPEVEVLSGPTVAQLMEDAGARLLNEAEHVYQAASRVIMGAAAPGIVARQFRASAMLLTSGDRADLIAAALRFNDTAPPGEGLVAIVLADDLLPDAETLGAIGRATVPVLAAAAPCYQLAIEIHELLVKIRPTDQEKIDIVRTLIRENVDIQRILDKMSL